VAALDDAIQAWSVFEQFFVLSYRASDAGQPVVSALSARSAAMLGVSADNPSDDPGLFSRLLHPDDRDRVLAEHWQAAVTREPLVSEYRMVGQDGQELWIYDRGVPVAQGSRAATFQGNCLDITPRAKADDAGGLDEHVPLLVANIPGVVYRRGYDAALSIEFMSAQIEELVAYAASDFEKDKVRTYSSIIHPDDLERVSGEMAAAYKRASEYSLEYRLVHLNGECVWVADHGRPVFGTDGRPKWVAGVILDITRRKAAESSQELVERRKCHAAMHDPLTGLANRVFFEDKLGQAISRAEQDGGELAVFVLDLDGFKALNDTLGRDSGDVILKQVARSLQEVLREGDLLARLASDDFAVAVLNARRPEVLEVIHRVVDVLAAPVDVAGLGIRLQASIGIATYPHDGRDPSALLGCASTAMWVDRDSRGGYAFYDTSLDARASARLALMGKLRRAIDQHELVLDYQPKMNLRTGEVVGTEALVRWRDPDLGLVMPEEFIPVAQDTDLIRSLTAYVLDEAGQQWRAWVDEGRSLAMSVNVSARDLSDPGLPDEIEALLDKWRIPAAMLKLEFIESSLVADPTAVEDVLGRLGALGLRLSVDDFGTGCSSIAGLKLLPIDEIKIDRSYVSAMLTREQDEAIVRSSIELAHSLGLAVVAEGAETRAVAERLVHLGCDFAQGFYWSRPVPADELVIWLDHRLGATERGPAKRKFREDPDYKKIISI
jgi:diguanylate cyclase (GGDEF)-like protein/PAS domain S-box-containing protein